jgi:hypothetical protein
MARDVVLFAQQRAARDFRRVGHEHGLDVDRGERALDLIAVDALCLQPLQDVDEAERLRRTRVAQIGAPPPNAVHLLGHVDHLEVRRERADEIAAHARRERAEQTLQLVVGVLVALAMCNRELAGRLDEIE